LNKELLFNTNVEGNKLKQIKDEQAILDRDVYSALESLESIRNIEIGSLRSIIDE
jgi:hypothetical protein